MGWKELLKERKEKKSAYDIKTFKVPDGKSLMRILPNKDDSTAAFFHDFGQHWVKDADGKVASAPLCLKKAYERECPYCEAIAEALGHMDEAGNEHLYSDKDREVIDQAKSRHRVLVNAAVRQGKSGDYKIEVVELASTAFDALINVMDEWGEEILSPTDGKDIVVERTGAGINTKYTVNVPKNGGTDIDDSWKEEIADLAAFVKSQEATPERHNKAIAAVGAAARLDMSDVATPALAGASMKLEDKKPAPEKTVATSAPSKDTVLDMDDLDDLESELDDAPIPIETEAEVKQEKDDSKAASTTSNEDDDLLAALDELENL